MPLADHCLNCQNGLFFAFGIIVNRSNRKGIKNDFGRIFSSRLPNKVIRERYVRARFVP